MTAAAAITTLESRKGPILVALRDACERAQPTSRRRKASSAQFDQNAAWNDIKSAVEPLLQDDAQAVPPMVGSERRDHYAKLSEDLEAVRERVAALLKTPGLIEPLLLVSNPSSDPNDLNTGFGSSERADVEAKLNSFLKHLAVLEAGVRHAAIEAAGLVVKHRPSETGMLSQLVWQLAFIYKKYTGRTPKRSARDASGPFTSFVTAVAPNYAPAQVNEAIKKARASDRWFMVERWRIPADEFTAISDDAVMGIN